METTQKGLAIISERSAQISVKEETFGTGAFHGEEWIRQSTQEAVLRVVRRESFDSGDCQIGTDYSATVFIPLPEAKLHTLETMFGGYQGKQEELVVEMQISSLRWNDKERKWSRSIEASIRKMSEIDPIAQKLLRGESP